MNDDVRLRDVPGPSALGGGFKRSLDLLLMISAIDFKKSYFGTALGYLWSLMRPLLLFGVLLAVFTQVFHFGRGVPHYPELLLLNIVLFGFFQEATGLAVSSIVSQESIVRKTQFPRLIIPLSVVLTSLYNLALNLIAVVIFMLVAGVSPRWTWLLFVVPLAALIVLTTAVAMIVSSLYPSFRDIAIIWAVLSTVLFYGTPILYTLSAVHNTLMRHILVLNPLASIFELVSKWVVDSHSPGPAAAAGGTVRLLAPLAIYLAVCGFAAWIFNREAPRIAERL